MFHVSEAIKLSHNLISILEPKLMLPFYSRMENVISHLLNVVKFPVMAYKDESGNDDDFGIPLWD